jgi:Secretion system C-terminal sorting domain
MKNKINLVALIFLFFVFSVSNAQEIFSIHVVPSSITAAPAIHSGAFAVKNGKWIFIGGRRDGMHIMQAGSAFPVNNRNDSIFIVDPAANSYESVSAQPLPRFMFEALCSSNMQYYQDGKYLYMIGGYGSEDSTVSWITFPSLISVNLDSLLSDVSSGFPITNCFRQVIDSNMAVTGGALDKIDSTYYLIFGHRFDGRYAPPPSPLFTQRYTHDIRKFTIMDDGINLSINNYTPVNDTDIFHRRDFNLVPQIYPNHERGFTVFGGVFQKQFNLPFLTPIDISSTSVQHQSSFNENLNQYTTAALPLYDSLHNFMHTIFFGGISLYTLDTVSMTLTQDTAVPFVSTISKVTRDSVGNLVESKMQENMPALKGTNALFIPDPLVNAFNGRIIDLNSLTGNTRVGYIEGGIFADFPNVANFDPISMSRPNATLYEVYVDKTINAIPELTVANNVNNLTVYPNPVSDNISISFSVKNENTCEIKLYNLKGQLVRTLLQEKNLKGDQKFNFSMNGLKNGVYFCNVRVGTSVKVVKVLMQK